MGYNLSAHSVVRNLPQLETLAESKRTLRFPTAEPRRLAYKLREAIQAAKEHDQFRHLYDAIWPFYAFREERDAVVAEYLAGVRDVEAIDGQRMVLRPTETRPMKKTLPGVRALIEVISAAIKYPRELTLFFPDAILSPGDKHKLSVWTKENDWAYLDHAEGGVSLTHDIVPEEMIWSPE